MVSARGFGRWKPLRTNAGCTSAGLSFFPLAELAAISNLFGCLLQKVVNMLVGLGL
jgi:hypothetical protein